jgi:glyoxylase-like metal-dependent hydrolase (beta-lactamase superfamily II)
VILVDDKYEIDHANVMAQLKKVTNQPVRYVINTHYHADHSGGNAKLQALGARAVSSEKARERMVAGKQSGLTDITFDQRIRIRLGGKRVDLYHFGRAPPLSNANGMNPVNPPVSSCKSRSRRK